MTCDHCAGAIARAVQGVDSKASVEVDLAAHRVRIEPGSADERVLSDAIREAGYTPVSTARKVTGDASGTRGPAPTGRAGSNGGEGLGADLKVKS